MVLPANNLNTHANKRKVINVAVNLDYTPRSSRYVVANDESVGRTDNATSADAKVAPVHDIFVHR
jgi:hypothetical protein